MLENRPLRSHSDCEVLIPMYERMVQPSVGAVPLNHHFGATGGAAAEPAAAHRTQKAARELYDTLRGVFASVLIDAQRGRRRRVGSVGGQGTGAVLQSRGGVPAGTRGGGQSWPRVADRVCVRRVVSAAILHRRELDTEQPGGFARATRLVHSGGETTSDGGRTRRGIHQRRTRLEPGGRGGQAAAAARLRVSLFRLRAGRVARPGGGASSGGVCGHEASRAGVQRGGRRAGAGSGHLSPGDVRCDHGAGVDTDVSVVGGGAAVRQGGAEDRPPPAPAVYGGRSARRPQHGRALPGAAGAVPGPRLPGCGHEHRSAREDVRARQAHGKVGDAGGFRPAARSVRARVSAARYLVAPEGAV
eukprot:ctg_167.g107